MDLPHDDQTRRHPGPWRFFVRRYNLAHVVTDAAGSPIAIGVPVGCGPMLAAGPELLEALRRVAELTPAGSPANEVVVNALERFGESEGRVLADWKPGAADDGCLPLGATGPAREPRSPTSESIGSPVGGPTLIEVWRLQVAYTANAKQKSPA
jgi:hypothetical protein